jgi:hypothetical protein
MQHIKTNSPCMEASIDKNASEESPARADAAAIDAMPQRARQTFGFNLIVQ